jgi:hypothetical protein
MAFKKDIPQCGIYIHIERCHSFLDVLMNVKINVPRHRKAREKAALRYLVDGDSEHEETKEKPRNARATSSWGSGGIAQSF